MGLERLRALAVLSTEADIASKINYEQIIKDFSKTEVDRMQGAGAIMGHLIPIPRTISDVSILCEYCPSVVQETIISIRILAFKSTDMNPISLILSGEFNSCLVVGSIEVRASDSRPEGLCSMPDVANYPPSRQGVRARYVRGSESFVAESRVQGTKCFPPLQFNA
ncbi:hypothetical protein TNCV_4204061 [Trichonephila clavipes]|nr:hypothetical protein TNCV_4204061 [Trichonephila clavipes]